MIPINLIWIDFNCPQCGYLDEIQLIDIKTEKTIFCHNCKSLISISDSEASVNNAIENITNSINELENTFKNFKL